MAAPVGTASPIEIELAFLPADSVSREDRKRIEHHAKLLRQQIGKIVARKIAERQQNASKA